MLEADGGTRCAAITGGYVALELALRRLVSEGRLDAVPLTGSVAAVSAGMVDGAALLDLDYSEDSTAEVDANVVMTGDGGLVEVPGHRGAHAALAGVARRPAGPRRASRRRAPARRAGGGRGGGHLSRS